MNQQTKISIPKCLAQRNVQPLVSHAKSVRSYRGCVSAATQSSGLTSVSLEASEPSTSQQNGANAPVSVSSIPLTSEVRDMPFFLCF